MCAKLRELVDAYAENDLLTYASAISFQILSAIVPFLLFGFALRCLPSRALGKSDRWRR